MTERIAYELHHRFLANADFLLDLHSGGTHYAVSTLVGYYDDPGANTAGRAGRPRSVRRGAAVGACDG
ncbi:hypothetical protein SD70_13935 [Gordoniibacillus kamchatkensis]|uniref:Succinylglutamate desuccinylase n=1 Tax=Gordoniibacillus kamchatkensis TaxID=1590651 RepID=A0ABR5AHG3_9BACL|nr:hypothetical protein SD70_13935 [Paenibacillus sp. VKM B-2647]